MYIQAIEPETGREISEMCNFTLVKDEAVNPRQLKFKATDEKTGFQGGRGISNDSKLETNFGLDDKLVGNQW